VTNGIGFDFSELNQLAADLGEAAAEIVPLTRKAVEVTARLGKDEMQDRAAKASGRSARRYPKSIDYEMKLDTDGVIGAEIGPNLTRPQGALGILDEAPGGVRSKPQHAARETAKAIEADFVKGLEQAAKDALK